LCTTKLTRSLSCSAANTAALKVLAFARSSLLLVVTSLTTSFVLGFVFSISWHTCTSCLADPSALFDFKSLMPTWHMMTSGSLFEFSSLALVNLPM
jgi:hypothetical protein